MTTPLGDQPDWQTLVSPQLLSAAILIQQATSVGTILDMTQPFRLWGLWISHTVSTNASYVAAILELESLLSDGQSTPLLSVETHVVAANQTVHGEQALQLNGFTPLPLGGHWQVNLHTSASAANVFYRASAGIYYSVP